MLNNVIRNNIQKLIIYHIHVFFLLNVILLKVLLYFFDVKQVHDKVVMIEKMQRSLNYGNFTCLNHSFQRDCWCKTPGNVNEGRCIPDSFTH